MDVKISSLIKLIEIKMMNNKTMRERKRRKKKNTVREDLCAVVVTNEVDLLVCLCSFEKDEVSFIEEKKNLYKQQQKKKKRENE